MSVKVRRSEIDFPTQNAYFTARVDKGTYPGSAVSLAYTTKGKRDAKGIVVLGVERR